MAGLKQSFLVTYQRTNVSTVVQSPEMVCVFFLFVEASGLIVAEAFVTHAS